MNLLTKPLDNNMLAALSSSAPQHIVKAIESAADKTGVDFSYLLQQAKAESSFRPDAQAKTSSATGLYQFIEKTWLHMVDRFGGDFGIDTQGKTRSEILDMRNDPTKASFMAAKLAQENQNHLERHYGGDIGATELYFAHFMGASGASNFLNARAENPLATAADIFPKEAAANYNVFFDAQNGGQPRTLEGVYQFFNKKFGIKNAPDAPANPQLEQSVVAAKKPSKAYTPAPIPNPTHNPIPHQRHVLNMMDLIMLTQVDLPFADNNSNNKAWF